MAFSGALQLTDLDDFLAPSQACILPVRQKNKVNQQAEGINPDTEIHIDSKNNYYEVAINTKPSKESHGGGHYDENSTISTERRIQSPPISIPSPELPSKTQLDKAEISLNDCLACSGCVTSTESMLITLQSHLEVQAYIQAHQPSQPDERRDSRKAVLSISPQTLASLVTSYSESPSSSYAVPLTPSRLLRRIRNFLTQPEHGGWSGVWDTNFARQLSLREHVKEFKERSRVGKGKDAMVTENGSSSQEGKITPFTGGGLPMLASACPGWVCYAEKAHGDLLGFVSHTRSPQAVMGSLVKKWWATEAGCRPNDIYHVSVMPCYDKKLEASRSDFYSEVYQVRDVDCVLTTGELDLLLQERDFDPFRAVAGEDDTSPKPTECPFPELLSHPGTSSGSYLHSIITALTNEAKNKTKLIEKRIRGSDDHIEYFLQDTVTGETLFKGAKCYGFRNLQNLVRKLGKETGVGNHASRTAGSNRLSAAVAARRKKAKTRSMAGSASTHTLDGSLDQSLDDERTLDYVEVMACPGGCVNGGGQMKPGSGNAATSIARRTDKDAEGYRRDWTLEGVATEIDEGMRWSTRSWVTKVEKNYWQEARSSKVGAHDESGLVDLVVDRVLSQLEPTVVELISTVGTNEGYAKPQQAEFLRTRYHRVESEFNALTAKW